MSDLPTNNEAPDAFEQLVNAALYRFNCPDVEELTNFNFNNVATERATEIQTHVDDCPPCQSELSALRAYDAKTAGDTAEPLSSAVKEIVATLLATGNQGSSGLGTLAAAGVRGSSEGPRYTYLADDMRIMINTTLIENGESKVTVTGLVTGPAMDQKWDVQVNTDDDQIAVTSVDEVGNFMLESLPAGIYQLKLVSEEVTVTIQDIWLTQHQ